MNPVKFKIGSEEYQLIPHTGFEAVNLDRKVLGLVGRMSRGDLSNDTSAFFSLADALTDLPDSEYRWIVNTTLSRLTVITEGKPNTSLNSMEAIAEHFAGRYNDLYAVLLQVWKEERLSPFAVAPKTTGKNGV